MVTDHVMRRDYMREYMRKYRGVKRRPFPAPRAAELYEAGASVRGVAAEIGFDERSVRNHLKKLGVEMRPRGGARAAGRVVGVGSRGRVKAADRRMVCP